MYLKDIHSAAVALLSFYYIIIILGLCTHRKVELVFSLFNARRFLFISFFFFQE